MSLLDAIIERLRPLGDVYLREAIRYDEEGNLVDLEYPYWMVWPSDSRPGGEVALDDNAADLTAVIGVTSVATTPKGAQIAATNARKLLGTTKWQPLAVEGSRAAIRWQSQVGGAIDRDVVLPNTGRHPAYEVDFYRVESTPS